MKILKNLYQKVIGLYLSNLSLPMVYRVKSIPIVIFILGMVVLSILFNMGIYKHIQSNVVYVFVYASVLNLFFLKFNFLVRMFNVFVRSVVYFYKVNTNIELKNKITLKVPLFYYFYNIICFVLTSMLIVRIHYTLYEFSLDLGELTIIYSNLFSIVLALAYIDYISSDEICYKKIILNKIGVIIHFVVIFSIFWCLLVLLFNFQIMKPILCEPTDNENANEQFNQNTQSGDQSSNSQLNGNNQITVDTPSSNATNTPKNLVQKNNQGNINIQNFRERAQSMGLGDNFNSGRFKQLNVQTNVNSQVTISTNSSSAEDVLDNSPNISNSLETQTRNFLSHKVFSEESINLFSETDRNILKILASRYNIKCYSFFESVEHLYCLRLSNLMTDIQFEDNLSRLLNYAAMQDSNNNILLDYQDELLSDYLNFNKLLPNQLIYMNGRYSIMLFIDSIDRFVHLNIKGNNYLELFENIEKYKTYLKMQFDSLGSKVQLTNGLTIFKSSGSESISLLDQLEVLNKFHNFMINNYGAELDRIRIYIKTEELILADDIECISHDLDNNYIYWNKLDLFTFKYKMDNSFKIELLAYKDKYKLYFFLYNKYMEESDNDLFYVPTERGTLYYTMMEALKENISGLNSQLDIDQMLDLLLLLNPFGKLNFYDFTGISREIPLDNDHVVEENLQSREFYMGQPVKSTWSVDSNQPKLTIYINRFKNSSILSKIKSFSQIFKKK